MNNSNIMQQLKEELQKNALKYGDFTLASGQKSKYYINCKTVTLSALGSYLVGKGLLQRKPHFPCCPLQLKVSLLLSSPFELNFKGSTIIHSECQEVYLF